jgi:hypothetical protein
LKETALVSDSKLIRMVWKIRLWRLYSSQHTLVTVPVSHMTLAKLLTFSMLMLSFLHCKMRIIIPTSQHCS